MSTLTIDIEEETKTMVERIARERNLSSSGFINVAIVQSLARAVSDPYLKARASRADGTGFRDFLARTPDIRPAPGDELPD